MKISRTFLLIVSGFVFAGCGAGSPSAREGSTTMIEVNCRRGEEVFFNRVIHPRFHSKTSKKVIIRSAGSTYYIDLAVCTLK